MQHFKSLKKKGKEKEEEKSNYVSNLQVSSLKTAHSP